jgi:hypothetical protein
MLTAVLWIAAVALTVAEVVVSTWGNRADRQATSCKNDRFSRKAALWESVFEALLYADILLVARESAWLAVPIVIASGGAKYWAVERRRKKFRTRTKKPKRVKPQQESECGLPQSSGP